MPCPFHLCLAVCKNVGYTTVEHDFCTTCYERPPVLRDRFCWAEGVVAQNRFYCNGNVGRYCQTFELGEFTALSLLCVILCNQNIDILAGLPDFARDHCSIIISISAFYFYKIYFNLFSLEIVAFPRLLMNC